MRKDLQALFDERFQGARKFEDFLACQLKDHIKRNSKDTVKSYMADDELRAFQLFLVSVVVDYLPIDDEVVFSYRKGGSVVEAVRKHASSKFFFKTDLKQFFSSIDYKLVELTIREGAGLLPFENVELYLTHIVQLITYHGCLPPGFATSPGVSNACLYKLDRYLQHEAKKLNLVYTRYSDDIILSGNNPDAVRVAPWILESLLNELYAARFTLNSGKNKFLRKGAKVRLLGLVILPNGHVTLDRRVKDKVETLLYFYATDGLRFLNMVGNDLEKGRLRLSGYLSYIRSVDPVYYERLRHKYGNLVVDSTAALLTSNF